MAAGFHIVARRGDEIVVDCVARNRQEADGIFGSALMMHPDCEITLHDGDALMLSLGPRRTVEEEP